MSRKVIHFTLILLLGLQSLTAVASVHSYLEADLAHVDVDIHERADHHLDSQASKSHADSDNGCHHCCHCFGSVTPLLGRATSQMLSLSQASDCSAYLFSSKSFQESPDNPPPIY